MTLFALLITLFTLALVHARTIYLPPSVQVEGIVHAAGTNFFVSDIRSAAIFLVDIDSGLVTTAIPPAQNRTALGMYVSRGRLFVARGGRIGFGNGPGPSPPLLDVYDIATGTVLASCPVNAGAAVNDVAVDPDFAYYTDSLLGVVYKLRLARLGACEIEKIRLPRPFFKRTFELSADGIRANGIIKYKQGLVVANFGLATLFFIDLLNGNKGQQLLPIGSLAGPDGLEIDRRKGGSLLYVAQPGENLVSVWKLSIDNRRVSANFVRNITSGEFEAPTTVALSGRTLVVANSRFGEVSPLDPIPKNFRTSVSAVHI